MFNGAWIGCIYMHQAECIHITFSMLFAEMMLGCSNNPKSNDDNDDDDDDEEDQQQIQQQHQQQHRAIILSRIREKGIKTDLSNLKMNLYAYSKCSKPSLWQKLLEFHFDFGRLIIFK